jgi:hypothetical protein
MNAADTSASSAMADWTPLTVVSRSWTTAEIDTFITEVSTTSTNMAMASSKDKRRLWFACVGSLVFVSLISAGPSRVQYGQSPRLGLGKSNEHCFGRGRRLARLSLSDIAADHHVSEPTRCRCASTGHVIQKAWPYAVCSGRLGACWSASGGCA